MQQDQFSQKPAVMFGLGRSQSDHLLLTPSSADKELCLSEGMTNQASIISSLELFPSREVLAQLTV